MAKGWLIKLRTCCRRPSKVGIKQTINQPTPASIHSDYTSSDCLPQQSSYRSADHSDTGLSGKSKKKRNYGVDHSMLVKAFLFGTMIQALSLIIATKSKKRSRSWLAFSNSLSYNHFSSNWSTSELILSPCLRKDIRSSYQHQNCLDKNQPGQRRKRRRRRRKSSLTSNSSSFEPISTQRLRDRIRRRNHLKRGTAIQPRRAVVVSGEPVSKWKTDDILGIYDLVGTDPTGRPIYKVSYSCKLENNLQSN